MYEFIQKAGIVMYLMAGVVNYCSVCRLLKVKKQLWAKTGILMVSMLCTGMVIYVGDLENLPPTLAVFLLAVIFLCEGSFLKRLTLGMITACAIFAGNALIDTYLKVVIGYDSAEMILRLLFALPLYGIIRALHPEKEMELTASMWKLLLLLTAAPGGIVLSAVLLTPRYETETAAAVSSSVKQFSNALSLQMIVFLTIALVSFWGLLWAAAVLAKQKQLEDIAKYEEINRRYYENMEQQHFEIRRMRHDMANYLQTLSMLPQEKRDAYIAQLLKDKAVTQMRTWCGDATVNAVLTLKEQLMREQEIDFVYELEIPDTLPFQNADICALLANALDNAIEARGAVRKNVALQGGIRKEASDEQRYQILLKAKMKKGMFMMSVKNPSVLQLQNGILPHSVKKEQGKHGYGLKSIQEIVKRYGGRMEVETAGGWFELFVYMPRPGAGGQTSFL